MCHIMLKCCEISQILSISKTTNVATLKQSPFLLLLISMSQRKCGTSDILGICNVFKLPLFALLSGSCRWQKACHLRSKIRASEIRDYITLDANFPCTHRF